MNTGEIKDSKAVITRCCIRSVFKCICNSNCIKESTGTTVKSVTSLNLEDILKRLEKIEQILNQNNVENEIIDLSIEE